MKICYILFFLVISCTCAQGQLSEGRWIGTYTAGVINYPEVIIPMKYRIDLDVSRRPDSTFNITSISLIDGKEYFSPMAYRIYGDSLFLEEGLSEKGKIENECSQMMYMKFVKRKKRIYLKGTWLSRDPLCGKGPIYFYKKL